MRRVINQLRNIIEAIEGTGDNRMLGERRDSSPTSATFDNLISSMDKRFSVDIQNDFIDEIVKGLRVLKRLDLDQGDDYVDILNGIQDMRESLAEYHRDLARLLRSVKAAVREHR